MKSKEKVLYIVLSSAYTYTVGDTIVLNSTSSLGTYVGNACQDDTEQLPGSMHFPKEGHKLTHLLDIGHEHNSIAFYGKVKCQSKLKKK